MRATMYGALCGGQSENARLSRELINVSELQYHTTEQLLHSEKAYQIPTLAHASSDGPFNPCFSKSGITALPCRTKCLQE